MCWILNFRMVRNYLSGILRQTHQGQYLGKPPAHARLVGLIRNLRTGYIYPQFHAVYDNLFQTVMGGYENNDAVSDHILSTLVHTGVEDVTNQERSDQEPVTPVHMD